MHLRTNLTSTFWATSWCTLCAGDVPDIYDQFVSNIADLVQDMPEYQERLEKLIPEKSGSAERVDFLEELLGDFVGENMVRPDFLDKLAKKAPDIFTRLAQAITNFLDWLFKKAVPDMSTARFFSDLEKARDAAAEALASYARVKGTSKDTGTSGPKYARRAENAPDLLFQNGARA